MPSPRIRLVVLFGGQSAEHDVSRVTAAHVLRAADPERYDVVPVGITRDGTWLVAEDAAKALAEGPHAVPGELVVAGPAVSPQAVVGVDVLEGDRVAGGEAPAQVVVLPLLHGPLGEDGTVQGLLELADVAYVGAGVLGSALAMDKAKAKEVLAFHGIPQARWVTARAVVDDLDELAARVEAELGLPAFVKPANLGSSVGITKAHDAAELRRGLELAFSYDEWVVVEEAIVGREVELAVLGSHTPRVSVVGEIVPSHEFYDYDDKYLAGAAGLLIPADLPADVVGRLQELSLAAFAALRGEGLARVDFLYEEGGRGPLLNEVNTMPGFTPISMYPALWEASGVPYAELVDELVALALARHGRRRRRTDRDGVQGGPPTRR